MLIVAFPSVIARPEDQIVLDVVLITIVGAAALMKTKNCHSNRLLSMSCSRIQEAQRVRAVAISPRISSIGRLISHRGT